ncbi:uncharacterized protein LOC130820783 [Amaranthus tricolor]|uniref:uncharacterized protein LOC130820783 n=1 Tax=Amaranthus tricolor TaxID=29722 RepID=UPI0025881692|nr:uncharacterized protein LOC130820783 [Amaranthus tricolor]
MKVKTPSLLKKIINALSSKTNELRIRMMIFFLLHKNLDKTSLTNSLHALVSHHPKKKNDNIVYDEQQQLVLQNRHEIEPDEESTSLWMSYNKATTLQYDHDDKQMILAPDLTHSLFRESEAEMEMETEVEGGESNRLSIEAEEKVVEEEDIDQAADLFIQRFKREMLLQKQRSLDRHQTLLLSNA